MSSRAACYRTEAGRELRVFGNSLLVRLDPEPAETRGGIVVPGNVLGSVHRSGTVVAVGAVTGKKAHQPVSIPGLNIGDHVLFVRFHEMSGANPKLKTLVEEGLLCIRPADVLLVMAAEDLQRVG
jgi:co-chaperonin GroES (HSP10)